MNFIKNILASVIGFWIAIGIIAIIGLGIVVSFAEEEAVVVGNDSILEIDLSGDLKDFVPSEKSPLKKVLGVEDEVGFNQIINVVNKAKFDSNIKAISLKKMPFNMGWAQATELRNALNEFKKAGKSVWAYGDFYSQKNYYLATVADKLALSPVGAIELNGIHSEVLFLQISELIHSIWKEVKGAIETSRNIDSETAVNELKGRLPKLALENGLIDTLLYEDDYYEEIKSSLSEEAEVISFEDYLFANATNLEAILKKNKIAVIFAQGDIIYGKGDENTIGQELIIEALTEAVEEENIKAIVLRVDSPGGSALASDLIWNAIEKAKKEKPVVVSMGNLAASGGYYIACNANRIFAEPTTITGSIGVFGILPNASKILKESGINSEVVSTHKNNSHYSIVKPLDPKFKNTVQDGIEFIYDRRKKVAW